MLKFPWLKQTNKQTHAREHAHTKCISHITINCFTELRQMVVAKQQENSIKNFKLYLPVYQQDQTQRAF